MDETTKTTEADFQSALATEFGIDPPADDPTPPAPTPAADDDTEAPTPPAADEQVEEPAKTPTGESTDDKVETPEEKATREAEAAADTAAEDPKPATKDDLKEALRELNEETATRTDQLIATRDEVINKLYPEGIDKTIYDTNGNAIKTAQDIVDRGLINERTGQPFEYEEAASFMLEAQRKMNENVEELQNWAEKVAEDNISLVESNTRVMQKWGETLKSLPKETVEMLATTYITKHLKFDKTNSYITEMTMTPEDFYGAVMAPYTHLSQSIEAQKAAEAKAAEDAAKAEAARKQSEQQDRTGLPPQRGTAEVKANTGDPMLDALVDELKKG